MSYTQHAHQHVQPRAEDGYSRAAHLQPQLSIDIVHVSIHTAYLPRLNGSKGSHLAAVTCVLNHHKTIAIYERHICCQ
jgi:hypothetical protein